MHTNCSNEPTVTNLAEATGPAGRDRTPMERLVRSLRHYLAGPPWPYHYEVSGHRPKRPATLDAVRGDDPLGGEFVAMAATTPELVCTHTGAWPVLITPALPATTTQAAIHRIVWVIASGRLAVTAVQGDGPVRVLGTILDPTPLERLTAAMLSDARLPASWASGPVDLEELAQAAESMAQHLRSR